MSSLRILVLELRINLAVGFEKAIITLLQVLGQRVVQRLQLEAVLLRLLHGSLRNLISAALLSVSFLIALTTSCLRVGLFGLIEWIYLLVVRRDALSLDLGLIRVHLLHVHFVFNVWTVEVV